MKLGIVSDLHLGRDDFRLPATDADVVILAGDIARPPRAIAWAIALGKPVIYVAGNHEFYDGAIGTTTRELRALCDGTDVHFLELGEVVIDGVRFLGTTMWTDFKLYEDPDSSAAGVAAAASFMRDFHVIRAGDDDERLFTPEDAARIHERSRSWLEARLAAPHAGPTVVVTHHAPSAASIHPRFADSPVNVAFVSRLDHLLDGSRARLWVHGHTHDSFDYVMNGTRVVCNPRGYSRQDVNENPAFAPDLVIDIA